MAAGLGKGSKDGEPDVFVCIPSRSMFCFIYQKISTFTALALMLYCFVCERQRGERKKNKTKVGNAICPAQCK